MPFTGTPVVKEVTDGLVRITGIELGGAQIGTIGLHESLGTPDIRLPVPFRPRKYIYSDDAIVSLADSVQIYIDQAMPGFIAVPIGIGKLGTLPTDFQIVLTNASFGPQAILGSAFSFGVLAATSVVNAGASVITGDLGVSPGAIVTGFPPGTVTGTTHAGDATAAAAQADALLAFTTLNAVIPTQNLSGTPLDGLTLTQGIYRFDTVAALGAATLTFDGENDPNAVFVIQIGTDLTIAGAATVALTNGAVAQNVFWVVGGNVAIGAATTFVGELIAHGNITLGAAASVAGGLYSLTGTVTLDTNAVTVPTIGEGFTAVGSGPLEMYIRFH